MWLEFIGNLAQDSSFHSPATLNEITEIESTLEMSLPKKLKELLEETNGVEGVYGLGLIWSAERIKRDNLMFRNSSGFKDLCMSFDNLLFFADAGNGDQFAFAIRNKEICTSDIFVWNHENDSRDRVAPALEKYLEWWLTDKLKI